MDHLRGLAGMTRGILRLQAQLRQAEQRLEQSLLRSPTETEIAAELDLSLEDLARARADIDNGSITSIDDVYTDHSILFRDHSPDMEDRLTLASRKRMLTKAISELPEREALVLQLYYVEELNVYEVGAVLNVSTGRVSQIKKSAMERLRKLMELADVSASA